MMRGYADTLGCRRQYLLAYFGEQNDPPCGSCDNCRSGLVDDPTETGSGAFAVNAKVRHEEWGEGVVMAADGHQLTVLFDSVGYKTLLESAVAENGLLTVLR